MFVNVPHSATVKWNYVQIVMVFGQLWSSAEQTNKLNWVLDTQTILDSGIHSLLF